MKYAGISWEGGLIGPQTIDKLSDDNTLKGQKPGDFCLQGKVKDEIAIAWADAKAQWGMFRARREREDIKDKYGTSRTRQFWLQPFLALLGFDLQAAQAEEVAGKSFAISYKAGGRICPVHIVGWMESLDKKREGARYSPHSLVQEYLNLNEETLFAIVSNGLVLRILRDSSRLVKLSYLEFNLEQIFEEELYADFAVLFRLLHVSRWPEQGQDAATCLLEQYHQDSLENGERIRNKLSVAVEQSMVLWADGFLAHAENTRFRETFKAGAWQASNLYEDLLTLVYRILFLLVIEERDLVHPSECSQDLKEIYFTYYSLQSLRTRCRLVRREESRHVDLWQTLCSCFDLHEDAAQAEKLGLKPLAGDLFAMDAMPLLKELTIDNYAFARGLNLLDSYLDDKRGVEVRVNYAALNVEEFGSVYEGLLDLDACVADHGSIWRFCFTKGNDRGRSGSHYTPEELVQPLIEHALEPLITEALTHTDAQERLLKLKVCDDACGSGHILLNAARRIALELARVRTGTDNPDPGSYRKALREVIEHCIYGVDSNPQAVRLCKVALWLESHNPGTSLGFLDNHIKCGDSLVGLTRAEELLDGISEAAFASRDGDDKDYGALLRKRHKKEYEDAAIKQAMFNWRSPLGDSLNTVIETLKAIGAMDDSTPEAAAHKKETYQHVTSGSAWLKLKALADIKVAPFFINKQPHEAIATESQYREFLNGTTDLQDHPISLRAEKAASERRFFHWFLEFAEVMQDGGFDCFLGNPPFLGNRKLKSTFGAAYLDYLTTEYAPAGAIDLVGYFVRRNYNLLKPARAFGTLATNTIAQGGTREGGLEVIEKLGGSIVMAVRSMPWPGVAAVEVSQLVVYKGSWESQRLLDNKKVSFISTYLDDQLGIGNPFPLIANMDKCFVGSYVLGQGFILTPQQAQTLILKNKENKNVLFPYLNGEDLNGRSDQSPSRWVINFQDWPLNRESAPEEYPIDMPVATDYPDCLEIINKLVKPERIRKDSNGKHVLRSPLPERWWHYADKRPALYRNIASLTQILVVAKTSPKGVFTFTNNDKVLDQALTVFCSEDRCDLSILNSALTDSWFKKYGTTHRNDFRLNAEVIETFPFQIASLYTESQISILNALGAALDSLRCILMLRLDFGLTTLYNLFHEPYLNIISIVKEAKCTQADAEWALPLFTTLRETHKNIDLAVRDAYGCQDITLDHGFHELEFLPEDDRVRYTVSTKARKEILTRLLALNHQRHAEEFAAGLVDKDGKIIKKKVEKASKKKDDDGQRGLF